MPPWIITRSGESQTFMSSDIKSFSHPTCLFDWDDGRVSSFILINYAIVPEKNRSFSSIFYTVSADTAISDFEDRAHPHSRFAGVVRFVRGGWKQPLRELVKMIAKFYLTGYVLLTNDSGRGHGRNL